MTETTTPTPAQMADAAIETSWEYFQLGGFFNPEAMNHDKVRDLVFRMRDALIALRRESQALDAQGATTGEKCINCGEPSSTGGGYEIGTEENGGVAGPFCADCHEEIEQHYRNRYAARAPIAAPPLAPSSERMYTKAELDDAVLVACKLTHQNYQQFGIAGAAPREPQPSSEIPWQDAYEVTHVNGKPVSPSLEAPIHAMGSSNQPDIRILCTGEWSTPRWATKDDPSGYETGIPHVFRAQNEQLYATEEVLVTCPRCLSMVTPSSEASAPQTEEIKEQPTADDIPRRIRIDQQTPAEAAIRAAVEAVEAMPADVRLTDAVVLLGTARESVADYVDGIDNRRQPREPHAALLALITRWREAALEAMRKGRPSDVVKAMAMEACADELEAALGEA